MKWKAEKGLLELWEMFSSHIRNCIKRLNIHNYGLDDIISNRIKYNYNGFSYKQIKKQLRKNELTIKLMNRELDIRQKYPEYKAFIVKMMTNRNDCNIILAFSDWLEDRQIMGVMKNRLRRIAKRILEQQIKEFKLDLTNGFM